MTGLIHPMTLTSALGQGRTPCIVYLVFGKYRQVLPLLALGNDDKLRTIVNSSNIVDFSSLMIRVYLHSRAEKKKKGGGFFFSLSFHINL